MKKAVAVLLTLSLCGCTTEGNEEVGFDIEQLAQAEEISLEREMRQTEIRFRSLR